MTIDLVTPFLRLIGGGKESVSEKKYILISDFMIGSLFFALEVSILTSNYHEPKIKLISRITEIMYASA